MDSASEVLIIIILDEKNGQEKEPSARDFPAQYKLAQDLTKMNKTLLLKLLKPENTLRKKDVDRR